jgi:hypothetical protein
MDKYMLFLNNLLNNLYIDSPYVSVHIMIPCLLLLFSSGISLLWIKFCRGYFVNVNIIRLLDLAKTNHRLIAFFILGLWVFCISFDILYFIYWG